MHAGALDMLHDPADDVILAVAQRIHVDFDGVVEKFVDQHRMLGRSGHGVGHVVLQRVAVVNDLHRPPAKNIGRTDQNGIAQTFGNLESFIVGPRDAVIRLLDSELVDQLGEALAVFGQIDTVGRSADDRHAGALQRQRELERRLPAELNDDTVGLFAIDDVHHFFEGQRLEVKLIRGIVIGAHGFRIAIDHDRFVTFFAERKGGVHAAVVELDALADPVRPAARIMIFFRAVGLDSSSPS